MIATIKPDYHLTIGIVNVTYAFQNILMASCECDIIDFPPHYITWFKHHFPTIHIKPDPDGRYVMEICRAIQGNKPAVRQLNTIINMFISSLGFTKHVIYHAMYILHPKSAKDVLIVGCSKNEFLYAYYRTNILLDFLSRINKYFTVISKEGSEISYINLHIIQSPNRIRIDQPDHIKAVILEQ